ncbi:MAG: hypothetical protein ABSE86_17320 [Bryobacteraceae bacterium]|jgi:hypothetical protein
MAVSLTGKTLYTAAWVNRNIDQRHVPLERAAHAGETVTVEHLLQPRKAANRR